MLKKAHSDARETGGGTEYAGSHQERELSGLRSLLESRAKAVYVAMVVVMTLSAVLAFTVFKPDRQLPDPEGPSMASLVTSGFGSLASKASALGDLLELQGVVNLLMEKDSLDSVDSLVLDSALTRMQQIENKLKP